jgi:hypothetical protein
MPRNRLLTLIVLTTLLGCTEQPPTDPGIEVVVAATPTPKPKVEPAVVSTPSNIYVPPAPAPIALTGQVLGDALKRLAPSQAFQYQYQRTKSESGVGLQASGRSNGLQIEIKQRFEGGTVEQIYIGAGQRVMIKTPEGFGFQPDGADAHNRFIEFVRFAQTIVGSASKGADEVVNGVSCQRYTASMGNQSAVMWVNPTSSEIIRALYKTAEFGEQTFDFSNYGKVTAIEVLPALPPPTFPRG